jgi:hypothetical protein
MNKIKRITIEVSPEYHKIIRQEASKYGISIKIMVIRALALLMDNHNKLKEIEECQDIPNLSSLEDHLQMEVDTDDSLRLEP